MPQIVIILQWFQWRRKWCKLFVVESYTNSHFTMIIIFYFIFSENWQCFVLCILWKLKINLKKFYKVLFLYPFYESWFFYYLCCNIFILQIYFLPNFDKYQLDIIKLRSCWICTKPKKKWFNLILKFYFSATLSNHKMKDSRRMRVVFIP